MSLSINGMTTSNVYIKKDGVNIAKNVAFPKGDNEITEDSIIDIGKNKFSTIFGATTESKYGYAAQFDSVSRDYAAAMSNHDYATAAGIDVISAMDEKYQSIKAEIEEKYSGEEKDERLSELEKNYKFILDSNVISSTDLAIKNESAINKLRNAFAEAYDNAKNKKSSQFIETAYGSLANWSGACGEIDSQLKSYKELFEQFKEALYSSQDRNGGREYAGSLLKTINSGLAGVKEQNNTLGKRVNDGGSQRAKELWSLIEKKAETCFSDNNLYKSDGEKYQAFLKDTAHTSAIDNRLDEILKEILGEE
ncbi:MAG: hypothetical protein NC124_17005 [Clostridium sp.]|nr:hypothetical protein [Clostridium sp.]